MNFLTNLNNVNVTFTVDVKDLDFLNNKKVCKTIVCMWLRRESEACKIYISENQEITISFKNMHIFRGLWLSCYSTKGLDIFISKKFK